MNELRNLNLRVSTINVNSMNVSTIGFKNAKTYLKIEGVTSKRPDVILLSDMRANGKGEELKKLFNLTHNGNYTLYYNSTKDSRGVGVAIKRNLGHELITRIDDPEENYLLVKIKVKSTELLLASVYGPNENDVGFYNELRRVLNGFGEPKIIGGDFNTIMDSDRSENNLDLSLIHI